MIGHFEALAMSLVQKAAAFIPAVLLGLAVLLALVVLQRWVRR